MDLCEVPVLVLHFDDHLLSEDVKHNRLFFSFIDTPSKEV